MSESVIAQIDKLKPWFVAVIAISGATFGWGMTWSQTKAEVNELQSDVMNLSAEFKEHNRYLQENRERLIKIDATLTYLKENLPKRNAN